MIEYRCHNNGCRHWYDKSEGCCPECGAAPHKHNKWLRTASLNAQLHKQSHDSTSHSQARIGAKQAAREYIESL